MSKIEELERQIEGLSSGELAAFRKWFAEFDAAAWDRQFEADASSGKLSALGEQAREAYVAGTSSKL